MNLVSCDECGVVLDKDKIQTPNIYSEDGIDTANSMWDGDDWIPIVKCPVCENTIPFK